jgi:hypothetical protein
MLTAHLRMALRSHLSAGRKQEKPYWQQAHRDDDVKSWLRAWK